MLIHGDCLEEMDRLIKDGVKVDAVITDPPYGNVKGLEIDGWGKEKTYWDDEIDFTKLLEKFNNLLEVSAPCILFGQEPMTSKMITAGHCNICFSYRMIWNKTHFANPFMAKKAPLNCFEDIVVFRKKYDLSGDKKLRNYAKNLLKFTGKTYKQIERILGHRKAEHFFQRTGTLQFSLPTEKTYNEMIKVFGIDKWSGFKDYEEIINMKKTPVFNLEGKKHKSNILKYSKENTNFHPTQKPVALMQDLIKTYTNKGDVVLDFTMGSGTTGVACIKEKREFIGIEKDTKYFKIAQQRIDEERKKIHLPI